MTGLIVIVVATLVTIGFGWYRHSTDGRISDAPSAAAMPRIDPTTLRQPLGEAVTLVEFTSEFCGPCRTTAAILDDISAADPRICFVQLDVAERLELAEEFGIRRTPTVLVADAAGVVRHRLVGTPRRDELADLTSSYLTPASTPTKGAS